MLHTKHVPGNSAYRFDSWLLCKLVSPTGISTTLSNHNSLKTGSTSVLFVDFYDYDELFNESFTTVIVSKWLLIWAVFARALFCTLFLKLLSSYLSSQSCSWHHYFLLALTRSWSLHHSLLSVFSSLLFCQSFSPTCHLVGSPSSSPAWEINPFLYIILFCLSALHPCSLHSLLSSLVSFLFSPSFSPVWSLITLISFCCLHYSLCEVVQLLCRYHL